MSVFLAELGFPPKDGDNVRKHVERTVDALWGASGIPHGLVDDAAVQIILASGANPDSGEADELARLIQGLPPHERSEILAAYGGTPNQTSMLPEKAPIPRRTDRPIARTALYNTGTIIEEEDWMLRAECLTTDPELFFPVGSSGADLTQIQKAKKVCKICDVRAECLTNALETGSDHGIWGGLTEEERRALKRGNARKRRK